MLIEMHCHTAEHSPCSGVPAVELVRQVCAKGLQGIVFTDHHYLWSEQELARLRRSAGVPDHFRILSGQEFRSAELGDVLAFGADGIIPRGTSLAEARQRYPDAALVWAHPWRGDHKPAVDELLSPLLDGIEIFNSNHTVRGNSRGLQEWHRLRFTAIGGTDTHGAGYAGTYPTQFDHPVTSIEEMALEIRSGRCRPFFKEIPHSGAHSQVTEVTIGTKGEDEQRERIIIRTLSDRHRWNSASRAFHVMEMLAGCGFGEGLYRVPRPIDSDAASMTLIEQGLRGKLLFDRLLAAPIDECRHYIALAARWLAKLHCRQLRVTPPDEFEQREAPRIARYVERFSSIGHRHTRKARDIAEAVREGELRLIGNEADSFVQGHGDYHPKNIFIGQDSQDDRGTIFVAAIDFESSLVLPPAFDVGSFLAQLRNQLFSHPELLQLLPDGLFLDAYRAEAGPLPGDFMRQVELFRARTNLSIAAYLIKVGMGDSEDLWRVLVEAEQALTGH
jgi:hypothetical protein